MLVQQGATAFREGWTAIKAGLYDVVLAVGVEQMGSGLLGGSGGGEGIPKEGLIGIRNNACSFC